MWIAIWFLSFFISPPETSSVAEQPERSVTSVRKDVKTYLIREASSAASSKAHVTLIGRLLALHCEIVGHSKFVEGFVLRQSRSQLQSRLIRIERRIRKDVKSGKLAAAEKRKVQQIPVFEQWAIVLAQQVGGPFGPGGPFAPQLPPANGAVGFAGGGTALPDYGPELADLIRQVINPEFWGESGGPGTVVYFAPRQVLVVRATSDTHRRVATLLEDLRNAGGP